MKKAFLCLGFTLFFCNLTYLLTAQDKVKLLPGEVDISTFSAEKVTTVKDTLTLTLIIPQNFDSTKGSVTLTLYNPGFPNKLRLDTVTVPIGKKARTRPDTLWISTSVSTSNMKDTLSNDLVALIGVDGGEGYYTIRLSSAHAYQTDNPFWIEFGGNVDLAEKKISNLFAGVFLYKRDWQALGKTKILSDNVQTPNIAIAAGVYESKSFSTDLSGSNYSIQTYYDRSSLTPNPSDSVLVYTDTGKLKIKTTNQNIGLFFSPQVRLTNGSANSDGIHIFFSLYFELFWQHITAEYDYSELTRMDTVKVLRSQINSYTAKQESQGKDFFSHYEGIGMPIFAKVKNVNLYVNPVFGVSNQPRSSFIFDAFNSSDNKNSISSSHEWNYFYLVQFRLNEEKYGLSFSGEVRQLIHANSDPFVTLVLSKKFNLDKLIEFF